MPDITLCLAERRIGFSTEGDHATITHVECLKKAQCRRFHEKHPATAIPQSVMAMPVQQPCPMFWEEGK